MLTVDHCNCFIFSLRNLFTSSYTADSSYFDVSIISLTNALAGGGGGSSGNVPKGPDCLRYATRINGAFTVSSIYALCKIDLNFHCE